LRDQRYIALRDVIARRATAPLRALKSKLGSRKAKTGNSTENLASDVSISASGYFSLWLLESPPSLLGCPFTDLGVNLGGND
jgi:hypothetical protein